MRDSGLNEAERRLQPSFINKALRWLVLLPFILMLERDPEDEQPNRTPRPLGLAIIRAEQLPLRVGAGGDLRLGGLWQLSSVERRLGGLSGLAVAGSELIALTDSGVIIRWPKAGGRALFRDLPGGPGLPQWKINRDSEALARDPAGRGWWVAFEQHHSLYLFSGDFTRTLARRPVRLRTWWRNWGVEALAAVPRKGLLVLPENGGEAIEWRAPSDRRLPLEVLGQISDAVRLDDGRIIVSLREIRPWGIRSGLASLVRAESVAGYLSARGVARARMATRGFGESQLLVNPERSEADRAANRRVEIKVVPFRG